MRHHLTFLTRVTKRNQLKITNDLLDKYKEYYESDLEKKDDKK